MDRRKVKRKIGSLLQAVKNILVLRYVGSNFNLGIDKNYFETFTVIT